MCIASGPTSLAITADNNIGTDLVVSGASAMIRWEATGVQNGSCTVTADGNPTGWSDTATSPGYPSSGLSTGPIAAAHTWKLACTSTAGQPVSASVTVEPSSAFVSITADNYVGSETVASGTAAMIRWFADYVDPNSCSVTGDGNPTGWPDTTSNPGYPSTGLSTGPIASAHTWTLQCVSNGIPVQTSVTVTPQ